MIGSLDESRKRSPKKQFLMNMVGKTKYERDRMTHLAVAEVYSEEPGSEPLECDFFPRKTYNSTSYVSFRNSAVSLNAHDTINPTLDHMRKSGRGSEV